MDNKKLMIKFPEGYAQALSRRLHGAKRTREEIKEAKIKMDKLQKEWCKNRDKLDLLYTKWEEDDYESHFREPLWYNAHTKRKRYENNMADARRDMFYLLTNFDGNGSEQYCRSTSLSAEDIYYDFNTKYGGNHE